MYKQVWVSEQIKPAGYNPLSGTAFQGKYWTQYQWEGGSILNIINGLFTVPVELPDTDFLVVAIVMAYQQIYPSWNFSYIFINGNTGEYAYWPIRVLEDATFLSSSDWYTQGDVTDSAGGSHYGTVAGSFDSHNYLWRQQDATTFKEQYIASLEKITNIIPDIDQVWVDYTFLNSVGFLVRTGATLDNDKYGGGFLEKILVDEINGLLIRPMGPGLTVIRVYGLASGNFIREIWVSGQPEQIFAEDENHAYVYCANGILDLVDYVQGVVLSSHRAPLPPDTQFIGGGEGQQRFAYERRYRRLLSMVITFEGDGITEKRINTTRVRGYYPVPLPVRITTPIPLKPPRKNRKTPVLVRLTGDILEPISGVNVSGAISGTGTLTISNGVTNEFGEVVLEAVGDTAASTTVTAIATIADNEAI